MTSELNNFFLCIRPIFLLTFSPLMLLDVLVTALIALFFRWDTPFCCCLILIYSLDSVEICSCAAILFMTLAFHVCIQSFGLTPNKCKCWIFYEWQIGFSHQAFFLFWRGFPRLFSSKTMFGAGILKQSFFLEYVSPYFYIIVTSRNK